MTDLVQLSVDRRGYRRELELRKLMQFLRLVYSTASLSAKQSWNDL